MQPPEREELPKETKQGSDEPNRLSLLEIAKPDVPANDDVLKKKVLQEVATLAKDGKETVIDAIKTNRVVGIGEIHTSGSYPNSILYWLTSVMPDLKKAGITHLALEVNKRDHQPILDSVMKTKRFDLETGRKIAFNDDWIRLLEAAAKNGITLVAVDDNPDRHPVGNLTMKENQHRETFMANEISKIVNSDANARVLWPVGDLHLTRNPGADGYKWAGEQLSAHALKGGWTYTSFVTDMAFKFLPLEFVNPEKPVAMRLKDAKTTSTLPLHKELPPDPRMPGAKIGDFDNILFVPWNQELQLLEKQIGSKSTKLLPHLERSISNYDIYYPERTLGLCKKALPLEEEVHGASSGHVGMRLLFMAKLCQMLNRDEEAKQYQNRGEKILKLR